MHGALLFTPLFEGFLPLFSDRVRLFTLSHGNDEINDLNELQNLAAQQVAYHIVEKRPKIKFLTLTCSSQ